jgi:hypothetical protein
MLWQGVGFEFAHALGVRGGRVRDGRVKDGCALRIGWARGGRGVGLLPPSIAQYIHYDQEKKIHRK